MSNKKSISQKPQPEGQGRETSGRVCYWASREKVREGHSWCLREIPSGLECHKKWQWEELFQETLGKGIRLRIWDFKIAYGKEAIERENFRMQRREKVVTSWFPRRQELMAAGAFGGGMYVFSHICCLSFPAPLRNFWFSCSVILPVEQEAVEPAGCPAAALVHLVAGDRSGAGGPGWLQLLTQRSCWEALTCMHFLHQHQLVVLYFSRLPCSPMVVFSLISTQPQVLVAWKSPLTSSQIPSSWNGSIVSTIAYLMRKA